MGEEGRGEVNVRAAVLSRVVDGGFIPGRRQGFVLLTLLCFGYAVDILFVSAFLRKLLRRTCKGADHVHDTVCVQYDTGIKLLSWKAAAGEIHDHTCCI